jgi:hypothetical protein
VQARAFGSALGLGVVVNRHRDIEHRQARGFDLDRRLGDASYHCLAELKSFNLEADIIRLKEGNI